MSKLFSIIYIFIISGCTSNIYLDKNELEEIHYSTREKVHLTNPTFFNSNYVDALKESNIFEFVDGNTTAKELTLKEMNFDDQCEIFLPFLISITSLGGLLPISSCPDVNYISYDLDTNGKVKTYYHRVTLYKRTSIWEWFFKPFAQSKTELLSEGLKSSKPILIFNENCDEIKFDSNNIAIDETGTPYTGKRICIYEEHSVTGNFFKEVTNTTYLNGKKNGLETTDFSPPKNGKTTISIDYLDNNEIGKCTRLNYNIIDKIQCAGSLKK